MRRFFKLLAVILLVFAFVSPVQAEYKDMWANVYSWDGGMNGDMTMRLTKQSTNITFKVLQKDSDTAETLTEYGDNAYTSLANPVTYTSFEDSTVMKAAGVLSFRVDPTESGDRYVDLIVVDLTGGYTKIYEDFDVYTHTIVIDERPGVPHMGMVWWAPAAANTETDTGIDFDYDTTIKKVWLEIVTVATTTVGAGLLSTETSGDADGFIQAFACSTAGIYDPSQPVVTQGTSVDYISTESSIGALLGISDVGSAAGSGVQDSGLNLNWDHHVKGADARSLTYTAGSTTGSPDGYLFFEFVRSRL